MRPSYIPNRMKNGGKKNASKTITQLWHLSGKCPKGTIPIRRTTKDDVRRADSVEKYRKKKKKSFLVPQMRSIDSEPVDRQNHEYAEAYTTKGQFYGSKATLNVWNPKVEQGRELSLAQLWALGGGDETLEAGWQVLPQLYGDTNTRLFVYWTKDGYLNSGCYNAHCPGFMQTNFDIALGGSISPTSQVDGSQYDMTILIWKDPKDGDWWLQVGDGEPLGYWPASMFSVLRESATMLEWGGEVVNDKVEGYHTSTQMGSGHFPEEGMGKASYIKNIQVVDESVALSAPEVLQTYVSRKTCYDIRMGDNDIDDWGTYFFFGGPGRNQHCL